MTTTKGYTIQQFVQEAKAIVDSSNDDRQAVVERLKPLVEQVVWDDGLFDESYRTEPMGGRAHYRYHSEPDGRLQITLVEFAPGNPTPVHDHITWGLIGICGGEQKTTRYRRTDDGSHTEQAELELIEEAVLPRGAVYPLLPPDDIHRIETVGDTPSYSLHVLGADLSRQHRNIYDPASGAVTPIDGQGM